MKNLDLIGHQMTIYLSFFLKRIWSTVAEREKNGHFVELP